MRAAKTTSRSRTEHADMRRQCADVGDHPYRSASILERSHADHRRASLSAGDTDDAQPAVCRCEGLPGLPSRPHNRALVGTVSSGRRPGGTAKEKIMTMATPAARACRLRRKASLNFAHPRIREPAARRDGSREIPAPVRSAYGEDIRRPARARRILPSSVTGLC